MRYLCVVFEEPLFITVIKEDNIMDSISLEGVLYNNITSMVVGDDNVVFYDWLIDRSGNACGLEIHLSPNDLLFSGVRLNEISLVELNCFVRVWFSQKRNGIPQGMEAFGDIFFFRAKDNTLLVIVGLEDWLSPSQAQQLIANLA
jgi:hypothetical protein